MVSHILVPLDDSPQAMEAVEYALSEHEGTEITLLNVIDPIEVGHRFEALLPSSAEGWYEDRREAAEELFETVRDEADEFDISTAVEVGRPSRVIVEYAADNDVDAIVMGSHGRSGVTRILLGSVAESVVRRSPIPVTVVR